MLKAISNGIYERRIVGRSVGRHGGKDLVRGRTVFAEDRPAGAALVLKVLRSDRHHAWILGIDATER